MLQQLDTHSEGPQRCLEFQVFMVMAKNVIDMRNMESRLFDARSLVDTVISFHFLNRDGDVRVVVGVFPMQEVLEQTHVGRKVH